MNVWNSFNSQNIIQRVNSLSWMSQEMLKKRRKSIFDLILFPVYCFEAYLLRSSFKDGVIPACSGNCKRIRVVTVYLRALEVMKNNVKHTCTNVTFVVPLQEHSGWQRVMQLVSTLHIVFFWILVLFLLTNLSKQNKNHLASECSSDFARVSIQFQALKFWATVATFLYGVKVGKIFFF